MLAAVPTQMVETWELISRIVSRMARPRRDVSTRAVDVEADVAVAVLALQIEELSDDDVGNLVGNGCAQVDDALTQEQRVYVESALAPGAGLDDHRDDVSGLKQRGIFKREGHHRGLLMICKESEEVILAVFSRFTLFAGMTVEVQER